MKVCACISGKNMREALIQIRKANLYADLIEVRLDHIKKPELKKLLQECKKKTIVTFRSKKEGGKNKITKHKRIKLLEKAFELNSDFVDLEFSLGVNKISELMKKKKKSKIILSKHFTKKTPSIKSLQKLAKKMSLLKPDIIKIVCKANKFEDNFKMIKLILNSRKRKKMLCFCMDKKGRTSRIFSFLIGNEIMFAVLEKRKENAGQLTVKKIKEIQKVIA
ncbi:type I 3-dehydroquinate dehydratase [Candidatus Micrarchaeota archaeon]|nr:type I 3-dehydroquinate dehydratase [Candidatus Micrarchaeota archaeon]MBU2477350.1 type I 3-dehydroquinate dehydratase [Candidatus Micrarchaeota archaeon]